MIHLPSRCSLIVCLLAFALMLTSHACADGKVFSRDRRLVSNIPDQAAMIVFDPAARTQTLVIETRVTASGTDLAWIVPLPGGLGSGPPDIFPATPGLFPTLRQTFAPIVEGREPKFAAAAIGLSLACVLIILTPARAGTLASIVIAMAIATFAIALLLPALAKSRGHSKGLAAGFDSSAVTVLDRQLVGSYETVTLRSTDSRELIDWLTSRGFVVDDASLPAIDDYIKRSWLFVASRLSRASDDSRPATPHPLGFKFTTDAPVYPLALTATGSSQLDVDLYIFGPGTASSVLFTQRLSVKPLIHVADPMLEPWTEHRAAPFTTAHPSITQLAGTEKWATHLHATLTPAQMAKDAKITFEPPREFGLRLRSRSAAASIAADAGAVALLVMSAALAAIRLLKPNARNRCCLAWTISVPAAFALAALVYSAQAKVDDPPDARYHREVWRLERDIAYDAPALFCMAAEDEYFRRTRPHQQQLAALEQLCQPAPDGTRLTPVQAARKLARDEWRTERRIPEDELPTFEPLDVPFAAVIAETPDGLEYIRYDAIARPHRIRITLPPKLLQLSKPSAAVPRPAGTAPASKAGKIE